MGRKIKWAVNIDKLKVCLKMPNNLYSYLSEQYSSYDKQTKVRILEEDDFFLVFFDEEENKMSATLNVKDANDSFKLGTFVFHNGKKYENKAFFEFENEALYRIFTKDYYGNNSYIYCLLYVANYYGMEYNNITQLDLAFDSDYNYISKVRKMIKNVDKYDLYLNGKKVNNDEILDGYGEFYSRNRLQLSKLPTLYFKHSKDTDMQMKIYDKEKELNKQSQYKTERLKEWLGWDNIDKLYRVEITWHNTNVREEMEKLGKVLEEWGEHNDILNLLNLSNFRLAMFLGGAKRLIYFKDKETGEEIGLVEVASGI